MKIGLPYLYPGKISGQGVFEETFAQGLKAKGVEIDRMYPTNKELRKIEKVGTVLTMASLREHLDRVNNCDLLYSTNGTAITFLDDKTKIPVVPAYHSTGLTIWLRLVKNVETMPEYDLFKKYEKELESIELVPLDVSEGSLEFWGRCGRYMAREAKHIVAVSENVKQELIDFGEVDPNKIKVIENGIEKAWFKKEYECSECNKITSKWPDKPTVMWIGRMGRERNSFKTKGIDRLLEVMDKLDGKKIYKVVVAIVPDEKPGQLEKYKRLFTKRGIDFYPNWPYEHLPHIMIQGDIFLMTSRYEGFSLSIIEAMACGMVPITYSIGVVPQAIQDKKNGLVVKNVDEMVEKVIWLTNNEEKQIEMAEAAKNTSKKRYQLDTMLDRYIGYYQNIISKK